MIKPIYTKRLVIRELEYKDIESLYSYRCLDCVKKYQSWEFYTRKMATNLVTRLKKQDFNMEYGSVNLGVEYQSRLIGDLYVSIDIQDSKCVMIGYTFHPMYWKQGFATEAVNAFLQYIFNYYHKEKVVAYVKKENEASIRLLRRLGFTLIRYDLKYDDYLFEKKV